MQMEQCKLLFEGEVHDKCSIAEPRAAAEAAAFSQANDSLYHSSSCRSESQGSCSTADVRENQEARQLRSGEVKRSPIVQHLN
jgi:hypothetical protein